MRPVLKSEFKSFCKQEYIQRIRSTPNLHTGTGLVERTIRTIKDLIRANLQDGLLFSHSLMAAIKTIRMTPNSRLKLTPFELHKGRNPRTTITNALNQNNCLLSNWRKLINKYVSAQPQELQVYTIKDSDGGLVDYLVMNEKRRTKSVSEQFVPYQFYEREMKPDAMKNRFKTGKSLVAIDETKHTVKTYNGKTLQKKLISNPISFQPQKKEDSLRGTNKRCEQCGRFYRGEKCMAPHKTDEIIPTMPAETYTMSDEDRRMGLGTRSQNATNEQPIDCLDLGLPSDQSEITGSYSQSEVAERSEEQPKAVEITMQTDAQPEPVETPIKLSTQNTVRINRRNFRSPAVSMIPTGAVEISEGAPENGSNRKTGTDDQSNAELAQAIESDKEDTAIETTVESSNIKEQLENAECPEATGEAGNGTPLNKPFSNNKPLLEKTYHGSENPCRSHRIKNA